MSVEFKNVLFPTDFSEVSLEGWPHAVTLANCFGAQLHCLHVVDEAYQYWSSMGPESIPVGPPPDDMIEVGNQRMARLAKEQFADVKPAVETEVVLGRPFFEIIRYAKEHDIDLIVMGTHGRGALAHVLLGSTTEKVVRKAPCAVMTVRAGGHEFVMP